MNRLVEQLLSVLGTHHLLKNVRLLIYDETPSGKLEVKIRCQVSKNFQLQIWLHHEADFQDYAYQLFTAHPILRWDNAPHYPNQATAPHHFHDESGTVLNSPLTGNPITDLPIVLSAIESWLLQRDRSQSK